MCGLSHPGGGLHHYLSQLLGLMQVKPLSRLLMMTKEQDGQAQAENDTIFNIWGIPSPLNTISFPLWMIVTVQFTQGQSLIFEEVIWWLS